MLNRFFLDHRADNGVPNLVFVRIGNTPYLVQKGLRRFETFGKTVKGVDVAHKLVILDLFASMRIAVTDYHQFLKVGANLRIEPDFVVQIIPVLVKHTQQTGEIQAVQRRQASGLDHCTLLEGQFRNDKFVPIRCIYSCKIFVKPTRKNLADL